LPFAEVLSDEPMSKHTTFKIGGPADFVIVSKNSDELTRVLRFLKEREITPMIIGNGSNLIISDSGIRGVVVKNAGGDVKISGKNITAESGAGLTKLAKMSFSSSLSGLEFAQGIPGSVGGAVFMNAGAYGGEISQVLVSSIYLDENLKLKTLEHEGHDFSYRHSFFSENPENIILSSTFTLEEGEKSEIEEKVRGLMTRRAGKQPLEFPSAGSIFKRPEGGYAAELIERCGLKGHTIGGAQVSEKHAGFIINTGGASADDVLRLIEHIQKEVLKKTGVALECEVRRIG